MAIDPCSMPKGFNGPYALVTERLGECSALCFLGTGSAIEVHASILQRSLIWKCLVVSSFGKPMPSRRVPNWNVFPGEMRKVSPNLYTQVSEP